MLDRCEERLESAIWEGDHAGDLDRATAIVEEVLADLRDLGALENPDAERRRNGILAFGLMREANIARQLGDPDRARSVDLEALEIARSADGLALGRCLLSLTASDMASGRSDEGFGHLDEARKVLATGDSSDHVQALGWSWILTADVANAGLGDAGEDEAITAALEALRILRPIGNWAGAARALQALAATEDRLGHGGVADAIRDAADRYDAMAAESHR
jgi:hypothetical protein